MKRIITSAIMAFSVAFMGTCGVISGLYVSRQAYKAQRAVACLERARELCPYDVLEKADALAD